MFYNLWLAVTFCASLSVREGESKNVHGLHIFLSPLLPPPSLPSSTSLIHTDCKLTFLIYCCLFFLVFFCRFCFCISHQTDALKIIRYLQHSKYAPSVPTPLSHPKEAWTSKVSSNSPPTLTSRSSTLSQRSLNSSTPARNSMNKSKYLGVTCVRHVIHHCAGYLLDSLEPPVPRALGRTSLMVIREAVINGAVNKTHAPFHANYP